MILLRLALAWLPGVVCLWLIRDILDPWQLGVVAAIGLLGVTRWFLVLLLGAAGYFLLDTPLLALGLAAAYRLVYADRISSLFSGWLTPRQRRMLAHLGAMFGEPDPLTSPASQQGLDRWRRGQATSSQHRCTPAVRCRHGAADAYRLGDRAMRVHRPGEALNAYLRALVSHPTGNRCGQILLLRAAEAAAEVGAARLAAALGAAATEGLPDQPYLRDAVVAARGYAVRARASAELGLHEEAAGLLRTAQRIPHRNRPADRFVRLSAVVVRLHGQHAGDLDQAQEVISREIVGQRLRRITGYEMTWLSLRWARELQRQGRLGLAEEMYHNVLAMTMRELGVTLTSLSATASVADRDRPIASVLAEAMCGLVECAPAAEERYTPSLAAAQVAVKLGDAYTAGRLFAAILRVYGKAEFSEHAGTQVDLGPWLFADDHLQARWARVRADIARHAGTLSDTGRVPPWPTHSEPKADLERAGTTATRLFTDLAQALPTVFSAAVTQVHLTIAAVNGADVAIGIEAGDTAPTTLSVPVDLSRETEPGTEEEQPAPATPRSRRPLLVEPAWLADADRLTHGRCVTTRLAWQTCQALGHHRLGVEHLFLAALSDGECHAAAAAAGVPDARVRRAVELTPCGVTTEPAPLTVAARAVLVAAAALARHLDSALVRPWHLVLATLAAPPSVVTALLPDATADDIAVRLAYGATNPRRDERVVRPQHSFAESFSAPARGVLTQVLGLPGSLLVSEQDLAKAIAEDLLAPPSVRTRAAATVVSSIPVTPGPTFAAPRTLPARLARALRHRNTTAAAWSRGVDLSDLVDVVAQLSGERNSDQTALSPSPALRGILGRGTALARADGHSYVGPEHIRRGLDGDETTPATPWPRLVFTPTTKRLLDAAAALSSGPVVEVTDLASALQEGTR